MTDDAALKSALYAAGATLVTLRAGEAEVVAAADDHEAIVRVGRCLAPRVMVICRLPERAEWARQRRENGTFAKGHGDDE